MGLAGEGWRGGEKMQTTVIEQKSKNNKNKNKISIFKEKTDNIMLTEMLSNQNSHILLVLECKMVQHLAVFCKTKQAPI